MATENSSAETCSRAADLAAAIGAHHLNFEIDTILEAIVGTFGEATGGGHRPRFRAQGGTATENLALQNIQARTRMVMQYMLAMLMPWVRGRNGGGLLVLGSANVDECLRGYFTKYDCSSADLNPIGGISKRDLRTFVTYCKLEYDLPLLEGFLDATPTAELEPVTSDYVQSDEADMGMSYDELGFYGHCRKVLRCGPYSMFQSMTRLYSHLSPTVVAEKVKFFFKMYAINRHKTTVLTPSYHAENYAPDDNRFDLRQFLYNVRWPWQFRKIDENVAQREAALATAAAEAAEREEEEAHARAMPAFNRRTDIQFELLARTGSASFARAAAAAIAEKEEDEEEEARPDAPRQFRTATDLVVEAITTLKKPGSSKGVSRNAIKKYIGGESTIARINLTLENLVDEGKIIQIKESFVMAKT